MDREQANEANHGPSMDAPNPVPSDDSDLTNLASFFQMVAAVNFNTEPEDDAPPGAPPDYRAAEAAAMAEEESEDDEPIVRPRRSRYIDDEAAEA